MPTDDTSVVVLASLPSVLPPSDDQTPRFGGDRSSVDDQGVHTTLDFANGERIQILEIGSAPAAAVIPLDLDGFGRLEAVHRLLADIHGRIIPPDTRLTQQRRMRATRMLRAFDGAREGATQQDIAQILFRMGPVSRHEWQASSTRHAVMSLLRDARTMVAGGYRTLLRHRRRP